MEKNMTKKITIAAMLTAITLIYIRFMPTFDLALWSFTLFSHTFIMLGAFISPFVGLFTCIATFLGFLLKGATPFVLMRAGSHVFFVVYLIFILKKVPLTNMKNVLFVNITVAIVHAAFEIIAVYLSIALAFPFPPGADATAGFIYGIVGGGTIGHSLIDFFVGYYLFKALVRAKLVNGHSNV